MVRALDVPGQYTPEQKARARLLLARCEEISYEETGRMVLPKHFLKLAEIDGEATFVGIGSTFQIWRPERYLAYEASIVGDNGESGSLADLPVPVPPGEGGL